MPKPSTASAYDELVAAIGQAVSDIGVHCFTENVGMHTVCEWCKLKATTNNLDSICGVSRPITLEDVLRAIPPFVIRVCSGTGQIVDHTKTWEGVSPCSWHLGQDLAWHRDNAPETIMFLHSLLCK